MNTRRIGRWAAAVGAAAALAGAQVMVQVVGATPASAAVPGIEVRSATSALNSDTLKEVTASCPAGKRVIGTGFHLLGGQGDVVLDDVRPQADRVTVSAGEDQDGTNATWKITALAVCAFAPAGLEIVTVTSGFGPSTSKGAFADCPSGKQVIGTGAALSQGFGQISIGNLVTSQTRVSAFGIDDEDGFSGGWSITAYAICAFPLPGYEIKGGASAFDSSTQKLASVNCSAGRVATGLGWGMGGGGEAHVNFAGIGVGNSSSPGGVTLVANEDDNGFFGNWQLNPVVICAFA